MDLCRHSVWGLPQWAKSHWTTSNKHNDAAGGNPLYGDNIQYIMHTPTFSI